MKNAETYRNRIELIQGTLDMLILQALQLGPDARLRHPQSIFRLKSDEVLQVETGSLYPALHRLERQRWVKSEWKQTESKQRGKFYQITAKGKEQLSADHERWQAHGACNCRGDGAECQAGRGAGMSFKRAWDRRKDELREELAAHLRMAIEERMARGQSLEEARTAAAREMGNPPLIADVTRDKWGWAWCERVAQDLRLAARQMRKNPGFAATAVFVLTLGIGAAVAIYSFVDAALTRPLPTRTHRASSFFMKATPLGRTSTCRISITLTS